MPAPNGGTAESADHLEVSLGVVQSLGPLLGDRHDVLDADPEPSGEVDPRLDGEAHPGPERLAVAGHEVRLLVHVQADPVAGAVHEQNPETRPFDDLACG